MLEATPAIASRKHQAIGGLRTSMGAASRNIVSCLYSPYEFVFSFLDAGESGSRRSVGDLDINYQYV